MKNLDDKQGLIRYQDSMFKDLRSLIKEHGDQVLTDAQWKWVFKLLEIRKRYTLLSKNQSEILKDILTKSRWRVRYKGKVTKASY